MSMDMILTAYGIFELLMLKCHCWFAHTPVVSLLFYMMCVAMSHRSWRRLGWTLRAC